MTIHHGMPAADPGDAGRERPWSRPDGGSAPRPSGRRTAVIRRPTEPGSPALLFTQAEFPAFVGGAERGPADHLVH